MYIRGDMSGLRGLGDAYPVDLEAGDYGYGDTGVPGATSEATADTGNWWSGGANSGSAGDTSWDGTFPGGDASNTGPTKGIDWTGVFSSASKAFSDFKASKTPGAVLPGAPGLPARPVSSPFTGALAGAGVPIMLMLGFGIFALSRRK